MVIKINTPKSTDFGVTCLGGIGPDGRRFMTHIQYLVARTHAASLVIWYWNSSEIPQTTEWPQLNNTTLHFELY